MNIRSFITTTAAAVALVASFASCNSESTDENHTFSFNRGNIWAYADQKVDTFRVYYTDAWTLNKPIDDSWATVTYNNQSLPVTVTPTNGTFVNVSDRITVEMQPNNTGNLRVTTIPVVSSYSKLGTFAMYVAQRPYLNISYPAATTVTEGNTEKTKFVMSNLSADGYVVGVPNNVKPYITFTVYSSDATLTSSAEWLQVPEKTTLPGIPAYTPNELQKVELTAEKNTTGESRNATLTLTSNGVSTNIEVTQLGKQ